MGQIEDLMAEVAELRALVESHFPPNGPRVNVHPEARVDAGSVFSTAADSGSIVIERHARVVRGQTWLGPVAIGERSFINQGCVMRPGVTLEADVSLGQFVRLITDTHDLGVKRRTGTPRHNPIRIGRGSWLGTGVTVLGGVTIGEGCVIAAGAVVTVDIPANTLAAGVPATVRRRIVDEGDHAYMVALAHNTP